MHMAESRTKNTKRNIIVSVIYTSTTLIFQFVSRSIIVLYLGKEYLGLSSLFASVLQVLNIAELGFSGAIVYNMYKPLADGDVKTVCSLLKYYRKIYRSIGILILVTGLIILPFIKLLIKDSYPQAINIYLLFALYLANTVISYFLFAYKTSLLEAVQRLDLAKLAYTAVSVFQYVLQILSLVLFRNYYLFVVSMIIGTAGRNLVSAHLADKYYPQYKCSGELSKALKANVLSRVKGLFVCNISSVTYTTIDSIIISVYIGLSTVTIYNNYIIIMTAIMNLIAQFRFAMQASVGNSVAKESVEKNYNDMILFQFLFSVIASWCSSCLLCLYQPFMELWMGADLLLPMLDVILLCVWFNANVVQHAFLLYLSANGLWWELKGPYIGSTIFNLGFNLILGSFLGTTGIILASMLSTIVFGLIWQCQVIFKCYFKKSSFEFYKRQIIYFAISILVSLPAYYLCSLLPNGGILSFVLKIAVTGATTAVLLVLAYFRTKIFKRAMAFARKAIKA